MGMAIASSLPYKRVDGRLRGLYRNQSDWLSSLRRRPESREVPIPGSALLATVSAGFPLTRKWRLGARDYSVVMPSDCPFRAARRVCQASTAHLMRVGKSDTPDRHSRSSRVS